MKIHIQEACKNCGKVFEYVLYKSKNPRKFCSRACWIPHNKLGGHIDEKGYRKICINKTKSIREHRLVMERFLGRKLNPDEAVHHRNGIKTDNRLLNLELMPFGEHSKLHMPGHGKDGKFK